MSHEDIIRNRHNPEGIYQPPGIDRTPRYSPYPGVTDEDRSVDGDYDGEDEYPR